MSHDRYIQTHPDLYHFHPCGADGDTIARQFLVFQSLALNETDFDLTNCTVNGNMIVESLGFTRLVSGMFDGFEMSITNTELKIQNNVQLAVIEEHAFKGMLPPTHT